MARSSQYRRLLVVVFCMLVADCGFAQEAKNTASDVTVQGVISKYAQAVGGEMRMLAIESTKSQVTLGGFSTAYGELFTKGDKILFYQDIPRRGRYSVVFDGENWFQQHVQEEYLFTVDDAKKWKRMSAVLTVTPNLVVGLIDRVDQLQVVAADKIENEKLKGMVCLEPKDKQASFRRLYFDNDRGFLKTIEQFSVEDGADAKLDFRCELQYTKVKAVEGEFNLIGRMEVHLPGQLTPFTMTYSKTEVDLELDDEIFETDGK